MYTRSRLDLNWRYHAVLKVPCAHQNANAVLKQMPIIIPSRQRYFYHQPVNHERARARRDDFPP